MTYRLIDNGAGWLVYDVVVDGVSTIKNYQSQFKKILQSSSYPQLVERLRKTVEGGESLDTEQSWTGIEGIGHGGEARHGRVMIRSRRSSKYVTASAFVQSPIMPPRVKVESRTVRIGSSS